MFPIENTSLLNVVGFAGAAIYVIAYALLQIGILRGASYAYASLNLVAALLVLIGLAEAFNGPSAIIQIVWAGISIFGLVRLYLLHSRLNFSDEETTLIAHGLPRMAKPTARKLLNRGTWMDAEPGTVLTTEGHAVTHLHFMLTGKADVISGGTPIAEITRGFIGEMNVMDAAPASATVEVSQTARIFTVSGTALRALSESDSEFAQSMSAHLAQSTKDKLVAANRKLSAETSGAE